MEGFGLDRSAAPGGSAVVPPPLGGVDPDS